MHGFDVFFDFQSIDSGNFEKVILENIKTRAHFLVILTPSALEHCKEPDDWLRREIETALDEKRNIVPLMLESFDFGSPLVKEALTGKLASLNQFNGLRVYSEYFFEAMDKLRGRYLNVALSDITLPTLNTEAKEITEIQKTAASEAVPVARTLLAAHEWLERGYVFWEEVNLDEAVRCYNEAISLNPKLSQAYFYRGIARTFNNELDQAVKDYDKAIHLGPINSTSAIFYLFRGDTYFRQDNFDKAIADYNESIRLRPDYAEAYLYRGHVRRDNSDLQGALEDYSEAIRLRPEYAEAFINRGKLRRSKDDFEGAILDFTEAIRLDSSYGAAYLGRGFAHIDKGNIDEAIIDFSSAVHIMPDDSDVYYIRGVLHRVRGDFDKGIEDFTKVIQLKPDHAKAYFARGDLWQEKKDYANAIADYQKYLDLGNEVQDSEEEEVRRILNEVKAKVK